MSVLPELKRGAPEWHPVKPDPPLSPELTDGCQPALRLSRMASVSTRPTRRDRHALVTGQCLATGPRRHRHAPPARAAAPALPGLRPSLAGPGPRPGDDDPPVRPPGPSRQHRLRPPASSLGDRVHRLGLLRGPVPAPPGRPPGPPPAPRRDVPTPDRLDRAVARPPHLCYLGAFA